MQLAPYVQKVEKDTMGRYLSITLRGKQHKETTIISAYRMNPGNQSSGNEKVWQHQVNYHNMRSTLLDPYDQ